MEEKNKRQQLIIRACCIIASFILWLYIFNVENPIRERKISVPVTVVNKDKLSESSLVTVGEEQTKVSLTIRGNSSDVYLVKPEEFKLESDLSAYGVKKGENKIPVVIKKSPQNVSIVNSENLWIRVVLDDLKQKTIPVKVVIEGKAKEGFFAMQPIYKTTEVEANGPSDSIKYVNSAVAKYDVKNSEKDIVTVLSLQPLDSSGNVVKGVSIKPESIEITVPIKKIKSVPINVKMLGNLNNQSSIKSITPTPEMIDIAGDEKVISNVNSIDTEDIDISKINNKDSIEAKIIVPKNVILINSNGTIKLNINFNKSTQKELSLDIVTKNLGNNYTANLDKNKVNITISGAENIINNLKPENIECFVDLNSLQEGDQNVNININLPDGVSKVSQDPSSIKVTITKKVLEDKNGN
ncbi:YbbR-like domain-containing protein [Clostridium thailandense]|uniref:CdaR family protein n=1 Tax=Clostridium thailandense TaxID=2794346 RepID=UPI003989EFC0